MRQVAGRAAGDVTTADRDRGPAARARAAGPRRAGAPARPVRRLRGRRPGGPARGGAAVAAEGVPDNPRAWLLTVAARRLVDEWRSESAPAAAARSRRGRAGGPGRSRRPRPGRHADAAVPVLPSGAVGAVAAGADPARGRRADHGRDRQAFLVPEATMAQRISRAKQSIKTQRRCGSTCRPRPERAERLRVVLQVLYLVFNEGYTASSGPALQRADLTAEAIRLARAAAPPAARRRRGRRAARADAAHRRPPRGPHRRADGSLVPLAEQDRDAVEPAQIAEGVALITRTLGSDADRPVPAAGRDRRRARRGGQRGGDRLAADPGPVRGARAGLARARWSPSTARSRSAMVHGPRAGLALLGDARLRRADGRATTGSRPSARTCWSCAGDAGGRARPTCARPRMTASLPEQHYLALRAARLGRP